MAEVVVVSAARTPFSKFGGALRDFSNLELGALVIKEVLRRVDLPPQEVDAVYYGVCMQAEAALQTNIQGRQALLKAGLPPQTLSLTIDRACCSSLTAVHLGYKDILLGEADVVLAVGAENMGRAPFLLPQVRWGQRLGHAVAQDPLFELGYKEFNPVARDAGEVALEYGVTREEQDRWALRSQQRCAQAQAEGKFQDEIVPVEIPQKRGPPVFFERDEFPKPETTLEGLARLPTIYGSPTVTAGNAPGLDTGAAVILLMSGRKAQRLGLVPLARLVAIASVAAEPRQIASIPALAIKKALARAGLGLEDMALIEINEAFAAMPLVASQILAAGDEGKLARLREIINVNGGAIALGHPVGASGARILMTLIYELRRRGGGYGVAAICGGLAQGDAAVVQAA